MRRHTDKKYPSREVILLNALEIFIWGYLLPDVIILHIHASTLILTVVIKAAGKF